jgi:hypothetical protein
MSRRSFSGKSVVRHHLDWIGKRTYVKPTDTEEAFYKDHTRDIQFTVGMSVLL